MYYLRWYNHEISCKIEKMLEVTDRIQAYIHLSIQENSKKYHYSIKEMTMCFSLHMKCRLTAPWITSTVKDKE